VYAIASNLARNRLRRERLVRWLPLAPGGPRELVAHPPTGAQEEVRERVAAASAILPPASVRPARSGCSTTSRLTRSPP